MNAHKELLNLFNQLADANDWHPKHSPKNLAMAISVEAAELLETFQWLSEEDSGLLDNDQQQVVGYEMADVFLYLLALADKLNIDLVSVAKDKISINLQRQCDQPN